MLGLARGKTVVVATARADWPRLAACNLLVPLRAAKVSDALVVATVSRVGEPREVAPPPACSAAVPAAPGRAAPRVPLRPPDAPAA